LPERSRPEKTCPTEIFFLPNAWCLIICISQLVIVGAIPFYSIACDYLDCVDVHDILTNIIYSQTLYMIYVNKRQNTNYLFLPVTSKVSCIQRKWGQIICLQGNNKSMVIFVLKRRKVVRLCRCSWYIDKHYIQSNSLYDLFTNITGNSFFKRNQIVL
jgi:hypothetical protein